MKAWGPYTGMGLAVAVAAAFADQLHKLWMVNLFSGMQASKISVTPFFDIVLIWNEGISYGLFKQNSDMGRWALIAVSFAAVLGLTFWLVHLTNRVSAASVGLVIGGALGNAIDRIHYGAVADFFSFHVSGLNWYVFNLADVAIVAGVAGLLYDSFKSSHKSAGNEI